VGVAYDFEPEVSQYNHDLVRPCIVHASPSLISPSEMGFLNCGPRKHLYSTGNAIYFFSLIERLTLCSMSRLGPKPYISQSMSFGDESTFTELKSGAEQPDPVS